MLFTTLFDGLLINAFSKGTDGIFRNANNLCFPNANNLLLLSVRVLVVRLTEEYLTIAVLR